MELNSEGRQADARIAVLVPCYNEERNVASVVEDFKKELPEADIYVYDNNCTDQTVQEARKAGALIGHERRQGKGHVVRTMFREVEADYYVMVDGDGTYPASRVHDLLRPVMEGDADMVLGSRLHPRTKSRFKPLNLIGNRIFLFIINALFRLKITDLLTGYRAFNRKFVKSVPLLSVGFEIETELTVKCIERGYRIVEVPTTLGERAPGSSSKIRVLRDGFLIFFTMFSLLRDYKPFTAFGALGLLFIALGSVPGVMAVKGYLAEGHLSSLFSALLALGLVLSGLFIIFTGLILHSISRRFQEVDRQLRNISEDIVPRDEKER